MGESAPARGWWITRWAVWSLPSRLLAAIMLVELLAVVLILVGLRPVDLVAPGAVPTAVMLAICGVLHTELAVGVERLRRRVTGVAGKGHIDLTSVWTFSAALLLAPAVASTVAIAIYLHMHLRVWRPAKMPGYRTAFTGATVVLAIHAAAAALQYSGQRPEIFGSLAGFSAVVLAMLAYTVVNACLVVGVIVASSPDKSFFKVLGQADELSLEIATLCFGGLVAGVVTAAPPLALVLAFPPLLVMHRAVLVRRLREAASTDGKTGLLNAAAWHTQAEHALAKPTRSTDGLRGVLVLDLDHFKTVNDTHGHIAGDHVLAAVADALRMEVRDRDLVGRFGGEEFVVLLADLGDDGISGLETVAERIRHRVANLRVEVSTPDGTLTISGLSVSVGASVAPAAGGDLKALLEVADTALYTAKRAGRNVVRIGRAQPSSAGDHLPNGAQGKPPTSPP